MSVLAMQSEQFSQLPNSSEIVRLVLFGMINASYLGAQLQKLATRQGAVSLKESRTAEYRRGGSED